MNQKAMSKIETLQSELQQEFPGCIIEINITNVNLSQVAPEMAAKIPAHKNVDGDKVISEHYGFIQYDNQIGRKVWLSCKPVQVARLLEVPVGYESDTADPTVIN